MIKMPHIVENLALKQVENSGLLSETLSLGIIKTLSSSRSMSLYRAKNHLWVTLHWQTGWTKLTTNWVGGFPFLTILLLKAKAKIPKYKSSVLQIQELLNDDLRNTPLTIRLYPAVNFVNNLSDLILNFNCRILGKHSFFPDFLSTKLKNTDQHPCEVSFGSNEDLGNRTQGLRFENYICFIFGKFGTFCVDLVHRTIGNVLLMTMVFQVHRFVCLTNTWDLTL